MLDVHLSSSAAASAHGYGLFRGRNTPSSSSASTAIPKRPFFMRPSSVTAHPDLRIRSWQSAAPCGNRPAAVGRSEMPGSRHCSRTDIRNTGPAVLAAALTLAKTDPASLICVIPSDHIVKGDLPANVLAARQAAEQGHNRTLRRAPRISGNRLRLHRRRWRAGDADLCRKVSSFIEKPPVEVATALIEPGAPTGRLASACFGRMSSSRNSSASIRPLTKR